MSFIYLKVLFKLNLYLLVLPAVVKLKFLENSRFLSWFTLSQFRLTATRGLAYRASYSDEARHQLLELRDTLNGHGYP